MPKSSYSKVRALLVDETEKALQLSQESPNRSPVKAWVPRSQCRHISKLPMSKAEQDVFAQTFERPVVVELADWLVAVEGFYPE